MKITTHLFLSSWPTVRYYYNWKQTMLSEHSIRLATNYTYAVFYFTHFSSPSLAIMCALRRIHMVDKTGYTGNHLGVARSQWGGWSPEVGVQDGWRLRAVAFPRFFSVVCVLPQQQNLPAVSSFLVTLRTSGHILYFQCLFPSFPVASSKTKWDSPGNLNT